MFNLLFSLETLIKSQIELNFRTAKINSSLISPPEKSQNLGQLQGSFDLICEFYGKLQNEISTLNCQKRKQRYKLKEIPWQLKCDVNCNRKTHQQNFLLQPPLQCSKQLILQLNSISIPIKFIDANQYTKLFTTNTVCLHSQSHNVQQKIQENIQKIQTCGYEQQINKASLMIEQCLCVVLLPTVNIFSPKTQYFVSIFFIVIQQSMDNLQLTNSRLGWVKQEEDYLKKLGWKQISQKINSQFPKKRRTPKQCRERYTNYIKYANQQVQKKPWSQEDDSLLFQKYMEHGSKWVEICKTISNRSENFLKNKFYGSIRRVQRKINRVQKLNKMKKHKPIKFDSLLKVLESSGQTSNDVYIDPKMKISYEAFIQKLKADILQMAIASQHSTFDQQILQIINRVHKFNAVTRFFNITKQRKFKTLKRRTLPPFPKKKGLLLEPETFQNRSQQKQEQENQRERYEQFNYEIPQQLKQILQNMQSCLKENQKKKDLEQELDIILKRQKPMHFMNCDHL